jgi:hypothetical protein
MSRVLDGTMIAAGVVIVAAVLAVDARKAGGGSAAAGGGAAPAVAAPFDLAAGGAAGDAATDHKSALRPYLGKPRPPLRVRLVPGTALEAGVPASIKIEVSSSADVTALSLRLAGEGGVEAGRAAGLRVPDLARGRAYVVEMPVTPLSGGPQRLSGVLEFELDGQRMAMPVVLPLRVGGPVTVFPSQSKPVREPLRDASGELVYPLAAD